MTSLETPAFQPTQLWLPDYERENLDAPIQSAYTEMNRLEAKELIKRLQQTVEADDNGTVLAVLNGETTDEYSSTSAMVVFNPFGNTATKGQLVRCEFVRLAAKHANVVDEEDRFLPVIMLVAPGLGGSNIKFTKAERNSIRKGELDVFGERQLQAVEKRGFTTLTLKGFSEGGVIVLNIGKPTYNRGVDITSITSGDPSNSEARGMVDLAKDLSLSKSKYFKEAISYTDLEAQIVAAGRGYAEMGRFILSVPNSTNIALYPGLGANTFHDNAERHIKNRIKLVVAYGGDEDAMAKPSTMEPEIATLYDQYGRDSLISVRVDGANHTWENKLTLLAKLYLL